MTLPVGKSESDLAELPAPPTLTRAAVRDPDTGEWAEPCPVPHPTHGVYCQLPAAHSQPRDTPVEHRAVLRPTGLRPADLMWVS